MTKRVKLHLVRQDRVGLVADVAECASAFGGDLGDVIFDDDGPIASFSAICDFPDDVDGDALSRRLQGLATPEDGLVALHDVVPGASDRIDGEISHRIFVIGDDHPGIVGEIAAIMARHGANIVLLSGNRMENRGECLLGLSVLIPDGGTEACLADVESRVKSLGLRIDVQTAGG